MVVMIPDNPWVIAAMLAVGIVAIIAYVWLALRKERKMRESIRRSALLVRAISSVNPGSMEKEDKDDGMGT